MTAEPHDDPNILCPVSGTPLRRVGGHLIAAEGGRRYEITDGIPRLFVDQESTPEATVDGVTKNVQAFYGETPFPNYDELDDLKVLASRARQGVFAELLRAQIPMNATVLEAGCGTGQLSNYLAATTLSHVYATDMTLAPLRLGRAFADENNIKGIKFIQMNLSRPCIRARSMDMVISNGVLHHTADARAAFLSIARLVKPGGHIVVGLYNKLGRLRTDLRRRLYKMLGEGALVLDPSLRRPLSPDRRRAWILDQYHHPQESKHSLSETLEWFAQGGFTFVSSVPKITGPFESDERLFEPTSPGSTLDRLATEIEMLFSHHGGEGGLFIMIGRKQKRARL